MREPLTVQHLSSLARDLAGQADEAGTVARIVELVAALVPCAAADVVRIGRGGAATVAASTDPVRSESLSDIAEFEGDDRALRCHPLSVARSSAPPAAQPQAPLPIDSVTSGNYVLRLHLTESMDWTAADSEMASAFVDIAAIAIERAIFRDQAESLAVGLETNRLIGTAIGILMTKDRTTYDGAFEMLKVRSQRTNRKLRNIAEDVILTGELSGRVECGAA